MAEEKKSEKEKPLDKMTVKELREIAKEIPEITGVHGMNKADLLVAVKAAKGIEDAPKKKAGPVKKKVKATTKEIKEKIKGLKVQRQKALESKDKKMATIYRRQISRLKKRSRKAA